MLNVYVVYVSLHWFELFLYVFGINVHPNTAV